MDASETIVNLNEIEKDLKVGLLSAEANTNENGPVSADAIIPKSRLDLGAPLVKLVCRIKNGVQFRMATKNLSDDVKVKLQHFCEVEDKEVAIYKSAIDLYATDHLSPELIDLINKYANSPLAPLIEYEVEKFRLMQAEVKLLTAKKEE